MSCGNQELFVKVAKQIVREQQRANQRGECIGCETPLSDSNNNTKPVSFFMEDGKALETFFSASSGACEDDRCSVYRIEEVIDDTYVKCRCIGYRCNGTLFASPQAARERGGNQGEPICTNQTMLLNLDCVCCLQCFEPIHCRRCGNTPG